MLLSPIVLWLIELIEPLDLRVHSIKKRSLSASKNGREG